MLSTNKIKKAILGKITFDLFFTENLDCSEEAPDVQSEQRFK
jgi:hypothetical protein